jgi:hypothetical protein
MPDFPALKAMMQRYEPRGEGNHLIWMRRGFRTGQDARVAAEEAKRLIDSETVIVKREVSASPIRQTVRLYSGNSNYG